MHVGCLDKDQKYVVLERDTFLVPRCPSCKGVHDRAEGQVQIGWMLGVPAGLLGAIAMIYASWPVPASRSALIVTRISFAVVGGIGGGLLVWLVGRLFTPRGVMSQRYRQRHPLIRQKIQEGWDFGSKTPPGW
jgi:hypothetical protein